MVNQTSVHALRSVLCAKIDDDDDADSVATYFSVSSPFVLSALVLKQGKGNAEIS